MKNHLSQTLAWAALILALLASPTLLPAQELVHARDGSGIYGYNDTPKLPWCSYRVHDPDRPVPKRVDPGPATAPAAPPSDAIVLFNGKDLSMWQPGDWKLVDGCMESVGGTTLTTKDSFGNCQIHLEWMAPANFKGGLFDRGNNGVMLMNLYEIQVFDSWNEKIYPDGQAAAVYGQTPPLVNACRQPGEWQTYDIIFTAPVFESGKLAHPARLTMFHNGVAVHLDQEIYGETGHRILPQYMHQVSTGPLGLAGHNCPVRFRNIWLRPM